MTCGACSPASFRTAEKGRVFGYTVGRTASCIAHSTGKLHFMGAQYVFADHPHGNVRYRHGLTRLRKVMRPGDRLVLSSLQCLGTKPERINRNIERIEQDDIEVMVLKDSYFEGPN
ncbi:MAG: hypothetical protein AAF340_02840 [Pseudomonadota bacterium]